MSTLIKGTQKNNTLYSDLRKSYIGKTKDLLIAIVCRLIKLYKL